MSPQSLATSPPHEQAKGKFKKNIHPDAEMNRDFIMAALPLLLMGVFFYGPRVALLALAASIAAMLTDRFAAVLSGREYDSTDNSSLLISLHVTLLMPANVSFFIVAVAVFCAVFIGKHIFGGYVNYPFNPVAVGYCIAAASWPAEIFKYPSPQNWTTVSSLISKGTLASWNSLMDLWFFKSPSLSSGPSSALNAKALPSTSLMNMLLGNIPTPIGICCALVIIASFVYLLVKKREFFIPTAVFLFTVAALVFFFPRAPFSVLGTMFWQNPLVRLETVAYELLSGGVLFSAVFLLNEPKTLPKATLSRVMYAAALGVATILYQYYGVYEIGICSALLTINAFSGYFDRITAKFLKGTKEVAKK